MILDTNVVSEPLKPVPNEAIVQWLDERDCAELFITSITLAELLFGVQLMPNGKRKDDFENSLIAFLVTKFGERILSFDQSAAREYAARMSRARKRGSTIALADAQIASIAASHGLPVATRDEESFKALGVKVVNPWKRR